MLIPTAKNTRNITDFRTDPDSILEAVNDGPLYLFRGSTPKAVVLNTEDYSNLIDSIEDYRDEMLAIELASDPNRHIDAVSFDDVLKEYNIKLPVKKHAKNPLRSKS